MGLTLIFLRKNGLVYSKDTSDGYKNKAIALPAQMRIASSNSVGVVSPHHSLVVLSKARRVMLHRTLTNGEGTVTSDLYLYDTQRATPPIPLQTEHSLHSWSPSGNYLFIITGHLNQVPKYRVLDKQRNIVWEMPYQQAYNDEFFWRSRDVLVLARRGPGTSRKWPPPVQSWQEIDMRGKRILAPCILPPAIKKYIGEGATRHNTFAFLENEARTAIWVQSQYLKVNKQPDKAYVAPMDRVRCLLYVNGKPHFIVTSPGQAMQMVGWLDNQTLIGQRGSWAYDPESDDDTFYGAVVTWNVFTGEKRCIYRDPNPAGNDFNHLIGFKQNRR